MSPVLISEHKQRDIVNRFIVGQTCTSISADLGMKRDTVETVVRRAINVLANIVDPPATEPDVFTVTGVTTNGKRVGTFKGVRAVDPVTREPIDGQLQSFAVTEG